MNEKELRERFYSEYAQSFGNEIPMVKVLTALVSVEKLLRGIMAHLKFSKDDLQKEAKEALAKIEEINLIGADILSKKEQLEADIEAIEAPK